MSEGALCVFGGSFDPPHVGHVALARFALGREDVDSVWVLPVFEHAFGKPLTPFEHRLRMCELAFGPLGERLVVSDLERELGGVSRTLRLVQALKERAPGRPLRLLVGADVMQDVARWHAFDAICELAPPLIVGRGGHDWAQLDPDVPTIPAASSSEARERVRRGAALDDLLPASVTRYIEAHGLYKEETT